jgi:glycosyltransferase involved in cell wall biosynthesis
MTSIETAPHVAFVLKGYPRLSETFISQEIYALEERGIPLSIWSLRHPTDKTRHELHDRISAPVHYLPEYIYQEPVRFLKAFAWSLAQLKFWLLLMIWLKDLVRDPTTNRGRRFGQALILAYELPETARQIHAHFLHTPCSVTRYSAILLNKPWSFSAHAKDIWTSPEWEKREKVAEAQWGVTCTELGAKHLKSLCPPGQSDKMCLVYHGLDLARFPAAPSKSTTNNGSDITSPVRLLSVGRAVEKKGYPDLLEALSSLPTDLHWHFTHIGGGSDLDSLKAQAAELAIDDRIDWLGAQPHSQVVESLRTSDIFILPSRKGADGDMDGLPNVLMEAASQKLASVSTNFSSIPEFLDDSVSGFLVPPQDALSLGNAVAKLIASPEMREQFADAAHDRLKSHFQMHQSIEDLVNRFSPIV